MACIHIARVNDFPVHEITEPWYTNNSEENKRQLGNNKFPHCYTSWKYSSAYQETLEVDRVLMELLEPFVLEILAVNSSGYSYSIGYRRANILIYTLRRV